MVCLSQNVASNDFRCLKDFDFLALVLGSSGNGSGESLSDGSGIRMGLGILAGVLAGVNDIGGCGSLRAATVRVVKFSEEEANFSELLEVCTIDPVPIKLLRIFTKLGEQGIY